MLGVRRKIIAMFSSECRRALRVQLFLISLFTIIVIGLFLVERGGRSATVYLIILAIGLFFMPPAWLRDIKTECVQWWNLDRQNTCRLLFVCFFATLCFCLIAHGFLFTNEFLSHDSVSLVTFNNFSLEYFYFYIKLGRILIPLYELLKGPITAPWLFGVLFILWMTLASVLAVRLLELKKTPAVVLTCALMCTNASFSMTGAVYVYCMDEYALALLLATAAVWFICCCRYGWLFGTACLVASLYVYQAYFTVAVALCFFFLIRSVVANEKPIRIILRGLRYLFFLMVSFVIYSVTWSVMCCLTDQEKIRVEDTILSAGFEEILQRIVETYKGFYQLLVRDNGLLGEFSPAIGLLLLVALLVWLVAWLLEGHLAWQNKVMLAAAVFLLPFVFNVYYFLFPMETLSLVSFNKGLVGVFLLLCVSGRQFTALKSQRFYMAAVFLAASLVWQNIIFSNDIYMKKELEKGSTISVITRVIERIEQMDGYIPGETPVAIAGSLVKNEFLGQQQDCFRFFTFQEEGTIINDYAASYNTAYYIQHYLNYPMNLMYADESSEEIERMPSFPIVDSIQWIDDMIVVKLS